MGVMKIEGIKIRMPDNLWPVGILVYLALIGIVWASVDLYQLATVKWMFLEHDGDITPRKLLQLALAAQGLELLLAAVIIYGLFAGWTVTVWILPLFLWAWIFGFIYVVLTGIRWF